MWDEWQRRQKKLVICLFILCCCENFQFFCVVAWLFAMGVFVVSNYILKKKNPNEWPTTLVSLMAWSMFKNILAWGKTRSIQRATNLYGVKHELVMTTWALRRLVDQNEQSGGVSYDSAAMTSSVLPRFHHFRCQIHSSVTFPLLFFPFSSSYHSF